MLQVKVAPTVEELDEAKPVAAVMIEFSINARKFSRSMKALANSIRRCFSPTLADKGYIIVNRRGRNKLVDIRRVK